MKVRVVALSKDEGMSQEQRIKRVEDKLKPPTRWQRMKNWFKEPIRQPKYTGGAK